MWWPRLRTTTSRDPARARLLGASVGGVSRQVVDRDALRTLVEADDADAVRSYLSARSGLPGPRADLALMAAFADVAPAPLVRDLADDADEYLRCCGTVGLGRLLVEALDDADDPDRCDATTALLLARAADPLWRVREAVAMALQRLGDARPADLRSLVDTWAAHPHPLVRRAAVAGVCEPRLLHDPATAAAALRACGTATDALVATPAADRRDPDVRTLRQALGYCWSVAVAAAPDAGLPVWRRVRVSEDPDVVWLVRENERKTRLARVLAGTPDAETH